MQRRAPNPGFRIQPLPADARIAWLATLAVLALPGTAPTASCSELSPVFALGRPRVEEFRTEIQAYGALAPDRSHVAVYAPAPDVARVRPGLRGEVKLSPPGGGERAVTVRGVVTSILRNADPKTGQAIVTIAIPRQTVPEHAFAQVSIELSARESLALPTTAVIVDQGRSFVYRRDPDSPQEFEKVEVQVGERNPSFTEIRSGVSPGDVVLTEGALEWRSQQEGGGGDGDD